VGGAFENDQWQRAITLIVVGIEGQFLLAMGRVLRVIEVKDNGCWRLRVARKEVVNAGLRETGEIRACDTLLKSRESRSTGQVLRRLQREPLHAQFKQGIVAEAIGIIAVGIAGGDVIDPLGEEVTQGMVDI
jgi:hypothetical protein